MARVKTVELIDDCDGRPAQETVEFAVDGIEYAIDLSAKNAAKFRKDMQPWCKAASHKRRVRPQRKVRTTAKLDPKVL